MINREVLVTINYGLNVSWQLNACHAQKNNQIFAWKSLRWLKSLLDVASSEMLLNSLWFYSIEHLFFANSDIDISTAYF